MLLADVEKFWEAEIKTGFDTNSIKHVFQNAPDDLSNQIDIPEIVECDINILTSRQASLGAVGTRLFRRTGDVIMRVHTPLGEGTRRDKEIVDIILNLFEGKTFSGIVTQTIDFIRIGSVGDKFVTTVRIPFYFNAEDI